jgi:uncharacterized protein YeaO (DUF488 family)
MIAVKRVYVPAGPADGKRYLVERLWPRGIKKDALHLEGWLRELAPSTALRQWFHHDPRRWGAFRRRYAAELTQHPEAWRPLLREARRGRVTLLFSARDTEHNSAVALKAYLAPRARRTAV